MNKLVIVTFGADSVVNAQMNLVDCAGAFSRSLQLGRISQQTSYAQLL